MATFAASKNNFLSIHYSKVGEKSNFPKASPNLSYIPNLLNKLQI